jgi:hypothetical protein
MLQASADSCRRTPNSRAQTKSTRQRNFSNGALTIGSCGEHTQARIEASKAEAASALLRMGSYS